MRSGQFSTRAPLRESQRLWSAWVAQNTSKKTSESVRYRRSATTNTPKFFGSLGEIRGRGECLGDNRVAGFGPRRNSKVCSSVRYMGPGGGSVCRQDWIIAP